MSGLKNQIQIIGVVTLRQLLNSRPRWNNATIYGESGPGLRGSRQLARRNLWTELTCSIVGNGNRLTVLPVWEVWFTKLGKGKHAICDEKLKWDVDYAQSIGIKTGPARWFDAKKEKAVQKIARDAYKALGLSGYGRVDMRMDHDGNVYVIEANVNPDISAIEDFAEAAEKQGMSYSELIQLIVRAGVNYPAPWKAGPNKKYV